MRRVCLTVPLIRSPHQDCGVFVNWRGFCPTLHIGVVVTGVPLRCLVAACKHAGAGSQAIAACMEEIEITLGELVTLVHA